MICPQCNRELKPNQNKFGDAIFPRHKMMRLGDYNPTKHYPEAIGAELRGPNYSAAALYDLECPMSGKPVDL